MAIIMAVMLKYFIVEAYQIPTGSMQPTLMGNDEAGIKDRIIVDKLSFHFRDPERFEVVVFRYPLDRSKNFIKRICGMPSEQLKISLGDLWTRRDASDTYRVVRRPPPVQREVWKRIHDKGSALRELEAGRRDPGVDRPRPARRGSPRNRQRTAAERRRVRDGQLPGRLPGRDGRRSRQSARRGRAQPGRRHPPRRGSQRPPRLQLGRSPSARRRPPVSVRHPGPTAGAEERPRIVAEGLPWPPGARGSSRWLRLRTGCPREEGLVRRPEHGRPPRTWRSTGGRSSRWRSRRRRTRRPASR